MKNSLRNTAIDNSIVAISEVLFPGQILLTLKICEQNDAMPRPNTLRGYYKGGLSHISIMGAATVTQATVAKWCEGLFKKEEGEPLSHTKEALSAAAGGMVSAVFMSPLERLMTLQRTIKKVEKKDLDLMSVLKRAYNKGRFRNVMRGTASVNMREIAFSYSYLVAADRLNKGIAETAKQYNLPLLSTVAPVLGPVVAATGGVIVSHPADILRAKVQSSEVRLSYWKATKQLIEEKSVVEAIQPGLVPRLIRAGSCVTMYYLGKKYLKERREERQGFAAMKDMEQQSLVMPSSSPARKTP